MAGKGKGRAPAPADKHSESDEVGYCSDAERIFEGVGDDEEASESLLGHGDPCDDIEESDLVTPESTASDQSQPSGQVSSGYHTVPTIDNPPQGNPPEKTKATPFAYEYKSYFTKLNPKIIPSLAHVNCSYLSTPGVSPTLLQLKQHAQALTILIKQMTVSTHEAGINNARKKLGRPFNDGETFDFLNDLSTPYLGPEKGSHLHHTMPLTTLINIIKSPPPGESGSRDYCPLHRAHKASPNGPSLPYSSHEALIAHANEVLELLDHEYSAKGGLLAILPPKSQKADRELAETTLLGQLILHIQNLVQRLHDLEISYANSLDALRGEAIVPLQALSALGPNGRQPREMVYPQDRFVLVNAGEDVYQFLNRKFDKIERLQEAKGEEYVRKGTTGETLWKETVEGKEYMNGIVSFDVTTRYYRLAKNDLQTIFVVPAHGIHPATKATRDMENKPTVVSVVKPVWPERASMWEMRNRELVADYKRLKPQEEYWTEESKVHEHAKKYLFEQNLLKDAETKVLRDEVKRLDQIIKGNPKLEGYREAVAKQELGKVNDQIQKQREEAAKLAAEAKEIHDANVRERDQLAKERAAFQTSRREIVAASKERDEARLKALDAKDAAMAGSARELYEKLYKLWFRQTEELQVAVEQLKAQGIEGDLDEEASKDVRALARVNAEERFRKVVPEGSEYWGAGMSGTRAGEPLVRGMDAGETVDDDTEMDDSQG